MSTEGDREQAVAELEERVDDLEAQRRLNDEADELLERAVQGRLPLATTLDQMLPLLSSHVGAKSVAVQTFDEGLRLRPFTYVPDGGDRPTYADELEQLCNDDSSFVKHSGGETLVGHRLDVAGESFGVAAVALGAAPAEAAVRRAQGLLEIWCEELDNYLASIALARRKHRITRRVSEALKDPVLDEGIGRAIGVLEQHVPFRELLLVFRHEDEPRPSALNYRLVREGEVVLDSRTPSDAAMDHLLRTEALEMDLSELAERLEVQCACEEVLIHGVRDRRVLGRVVLGRGTKEFATFDRDLLQRFADTLSQRIIDFNREWKQLSTCFPPNVVHRLLREERYAERFLAPKDENVAILYGDIAGFTRMSEQVLREPALIGHLVNVWSTRVVQTIWETGGAFDKMVGDCVIGLWGPPFFEMDARTACRRAAEAARRIRELTCSLAKDEELPQLRGIDPPPGVATGLNYCPLFVGTFGPNEDYTGFSSGMNNTARLQGVADRDEILCMEGFVEAYGDSAAFGEQREAKVKNVAEPLRFRALEI